MNTDTLSIADSTLPVCRNRLEWATGYGFALLLFLLPLPTSGALYEGSVFGKAALLEVIMPLLLALALFNCRGQRVVRLGLPALMGIALIAWTWLGISWSVHRYEAFLEAIRWCCWGGAAALPWMLTDRKKWAKVFIISIVLSALIPGAVVMLQIFCEWDWVVQFRKPASTFFNKNSAAHFFVMAWPFAWIMLKGKCKPWLTMLVALSLIFSLVFLAYSSSRQGTAAIGLQLLCMTYLFFRYRRCQPCLGVGERQLQVIAVALLCMVLGAFSEGGRVWLKTSVDRAEVLYTKYIDVGEGDRQKDMSVSPQVAVQTKVVTSDVVDKNIGIKGKKLHWILKKIEDSRATAVRPLIWVNMMPMIYDYFFTGVGPSNFRIIYPKYQHSILAHPENMMVKKYGHAHNDYFQFMSEHGVPAFLLLVLLVGGAFRRAWRGGRMIQGDDARYLFAVAVSLIGFLVVAFLDFPMKRGLPPFVVALLISLTYILTADEANSERWSLNFAVPSWLSEAGGALLLLLIPLSVWHSAGIIEYYYLRRELTICEMRSDWKGSVAVGEKAIACQPHMSRNLFYQARALIELERYPEAAEVYLKLLKYEPHRVNALSNLAVCYIRVQERLKTKGATAEANVYLQKAIDRYKQLLDILPEYGVGRITYAALLAQKDITKAIEQLLIVKQQGTMSIHGHLVLSKLYLKKNELNKAVNELADILRQDVKHAEANRILNELASKGLITVNRK